MMPPTTPLISVFVLLLAGVCAAKNILDGVRIVNGTEVPEGKYPFIVSLQIKGIHFCGGTILNSQWVLTAGHCATFLQQFKVHVRICTAATKLGSGGCKYRLLKSIVHEKLNQSGNLDNDIALFKVCSPILLDDKVAVAKLPSQGQEYAAETPVTAIGWGYDSFDGATQASLMEVDLLVQNDSMCKNFLFEKEELCAYFPGDGKGVCFGDSGGPLVLKDAAATQVGITSFGENCGVVPMVFTEIANYIDWINHKIETN